MTREIIRLWPRAANQQLEAPVGPHRLMDGLIAVLEGLSRFVPALQDMSEFGLRALLRRRIDIGMG